MNNKKKSFTILTLAFTLVLGYVSCISDDENVSPVEKNANSQLLSSLDSLDTVICLELDKYVTRDGNHPQTEEDKDTINIVLQDLYGALMGAYAGKDLGGAAGSITMPVVGTISGAVAGAIVGGIIGAVACSWEAGTSGRLASDFTTRPDVVLTDRDLFHAFEHVISNDSMLTTRNDVPIDISAERVMYAQACASLHNYMLDVLKDSIDTTICQTLETKVDTTFVSSYHVKYNKIKERPYNVGLSNREAIVLSHFVEFFEDYAFSMDDTRRIVDRYLNYIEITNNLTDSEREELLFAISVAWYSYQYWSQLNNNE